MMRPLSEESVCLFMAAKTEYVEVATIRDPEGLGVVAAITERERDNGFLSYSFGIFKEYERGGELCRSPFLRLEHIESAHRVLEAAEREIRTRQDRFWENRRERRKLEPKTA
jgi:hypothetical protein